MKRPIEPADIRKGDRVETEYVDRNNTVYDVTYTARSDGHVYDGAPLGAPYYLLDRPAPELLLPSEPTTGWIEIRGGDVITPQFGRWHVEGKVIYDDDPRHYWNVDAVTAFTLATAVPTEALDKLRNYSLIGEYTLLESVQQFFAAVDKANEAQR